MGKIYDSILELVGHTPIVRLHKLERKHELQGNLLAKLESFNPNASVKDRIALELIEGAEKEGKLKTGRSRGTP